MLITSGYTFLNRYTTGTIKTKTKLGALSGSRSMRKDVKKIRKEMKELRKRIVRRKIREQGGMSCKLF